MLRKEMQRNPNPLFTVTVEAVGWSAPLVVPFSHWVNRNTRPIQIWLTRVPVSEGTVASVGPSQRTSEQADPEGVSLPVWADQLLHCFVFIQVVHTDQVCATLPAVGLGAVPSLHLLQHSKRLAGAICKRHECEMEPLCGRKRKMRAVWKVLNW